MSEAILVSIVTAGLALAGTVVTVLASGRQTLAALDRKSELSDAKLEAELKKHQAVTETKIDELTRKVEKHNSLIERMYRAEGQITEIQHDIRDMKGAQK